MSPTNNHPHLRRIDTGAAAEEEEDVTVLGDTFVATSENGLMLRRGDEATWTCIAPGVQARLAW